MAGVSSCSVSSRRRALLAVVIAALLPGISSYEASADEDVPLRIGMSTALSGPAKALGEGVKLGVEIAIADANEAGGIRGRPLELIALDDGYEPSRTVPNMRRLTEDEGVLAVIGNVGTPTAIAAIPVAIEQKTLFFGAFTGAGVLRRTPPDRYVINYRASYAEETAAIIDALVETIGIATDEIAFFTQEDGYGDAGFAGGIAALRRQGLPRDASVLHTRYTRNTTNVESALAQVLDAPKEPKAIVMVGAYAPCAEFIRLARDLGLDPLFLNVSFVGSNALARRLGTQGERVIITQVVPPLDSTLPIAEDYRSSLAKRAPGTPPSFVSLEGFIAGRLFLEGLRRVEGAITREGIIDGLESIRDLDIGLGFPVSLNPNRHQASHRVWPTVLRGSAVLPLRWEELKVPAAIP